MRDVGGLRVVKLRAGWGRQLQKLDGEYMVEYCTEKNLAVLEGVVCEIIEDAVKKEKKQVQKQLFANRDDSFLRDSRSEISTVPQSRASSARGSLIEESVMPPKVQEEKQKSPFEIQIEQMYEQVKKDGL